MRFNSKLELKIFYLSMSGDYHDNNDYTNSKSVSFLIDNSDDFANNKNIENK
jgi:hypothetical protein